MSYRSPNPSGSPYSSGSRSSGGWVGSQYRQSPQQRSSGGWVGCPQGSPPPSTGVDFKTPISQKLLTLKLSGKVKGARMLGGETSIANAFVFVFTAQQGPIKDFRQIEMYACSHGMATIASLLLFVFNPNPETRIFQEVSGDVKRLENGRLYLVIPSCIGTTDRRDPNSAWFDRGGVSGSRGGADKQTWGSGANLDAIPEARAIVPACDIKSNPALMRVPLVQFCEAMTRVGAIPLQVEIDSQHSSPVEPAATSSVPWFVEDEPSTSGSKFDDWGNKL